VTRALVTVVIYHCEKFYRTDPKESLENKLLGHCFKLETSKRSLEYFIRTGACTIKLFTAVIVAVS